MELLLVALMMSLSNVVCLVIGIKLGHGKDIKIASPVELYKSHKENKEAQAEERKKQQAIETMLYNIDVYDCTGVGQQDIGEC